MHARKYRRGQDWNCSHPEQAPSHARGQDSSLKVRLDNLLK